MRIRLIKWNEDDDAHEWGIGGDGANERGNENDGLSDNTEIMNKDG